MDDKTARTAVAALVGEGLISATATDRAVAVLTRDALAGQASRHGRGRLGEVAAWLGAALVLAAAGLFLAEGWADLSNGEQATALGGIAAVLAVAGLAVRAYRLRLPEGAAMQDASRRLGSGLLGGAAASLGFAVGLAVDAAARDYSDWPVVAGALTVAVAGAIGYRLLPAAVGQLVVVAGLFAVVPSLVEAIDVQQEQLVGVGELVLAACWLVLAERGAFRERVVAVALGCAWALLGAQLVVADGEQAWIGYLLTALVAAGGFVGYLRTLRWPYVAAAVVAVTLVVPEAVTDWTEGSVGPAGAVLLAGLALLGGSFAALWSRRGRVRPGQPA